MAKMTPQSRAMFFWPTPGDGRVPDDEAFVRSSDAPFPHETFLALTLRPTQLEYLRLSTHPHTRMRWTLAEKWECEALNP